MRRGLQEVKKEDGILSMLDAYEDAMVHKLQMDYVPNDVDWLSLGLGDEFLNTSFLLDFSESSLGAARHL
jgi:hypothetical protein